MQPEPHSDRFFQELSEKISALPAHAQNEAVFALFGVGLRMMERETIIELRDELRMRFPQNDDTRDLSTVLLEIIDGHLMLRELNEELDDSEL